MPKKNPSKTSSLQENETSPFPIIDPAEFSKIGNRNLEVSTHAVGAYFNGLSKINQEMMSFFGTRVKKDIGTASTLMTSKDSESAFHCQAEFIETAIRDYTDEISKIMNIAADIAQGTLTPVEERTEEVLHKFDDSAAIAEKKAASRTK